MSRSCKMSFPVIVEVGCQEEARKEEVKEKDENEERRTSNEVAQRVIEGIKKEGRVSTDAKSTAQRIDGQSVKQNWYCSQITTKRKKKTGSSHFGSRN